MPNRLPIPDDLQQLIEKREAPDRRKGPRRQPANTSTDSVGDSVEPVVNRRKQADRRGSSRRKDV